MHTASLTNAFRTTNTERRYCVRMASSQKKPQFQVDAELDHHALAEQIDPGTTAAVAPDECNSSGNTANGLPGYETAVRRRRPISTSPAPPTRSKTATPIAQPVRSLPVRGKGRP